MSQLHTILTPPSTQRPSKAGKFSSALSNSDSQFVQAFQGKQASISCLSCNFASLRLQFSPFRDTEAKLGNENLEMNHQITVDKKMRKMMI